MPVVARLFQSLVGPCSFFANPVVSDGPSALSEHWVGRILRVKDLFFVIIEAVTM
jgi:hypothetical protein